MKFNSIFFLLLLVTLICNCAAPKEQTVDMKFIDCLPSEAQADYQALLTSFDRFLQKEYDGSIKKFTLTVIDLNLAEPQNFSKENIELGRKLMENNFTDYIYTTYSDTTYHSVFSKAKGKTEKKPRIKKLMKVGKKKPYLKCLLEVMPKDDPLRPYVEGQDINSVYVLIQDFAWEPGYDASHITHSGLLKIMYATEIYSGMLMRAR